MNEALIVAVTVAAVKVLDKGWEIISSWWQKRHDLNRAERSSDREFMDYLSGRQKEFVTELEEDLRTVKKEVKKLQTDHLTCQQDNAMFKAQITILTSEKNTLIAKIAQLEEKITHLETTLTGLHNSAGSSGS